MNKASFDKHCPLCDGAQLRVRYQKEGYTYLQCGDCHLVWLSEIGTVINSMTFYDRGYFTGEVPGSYADYVNDEEMHRRNARRRLRMLASYGVRPPGYLVDVGCAVGFFLDEASKMGFRTSGVEVSDWAGAEASRRFGVDIYRSLDDLVAENAASVTAVTFSQSLEHMAEPAVELKRAVSLLSANGRIMVETWNSDAVVARFMGKHWQQLTPPSVLYLFSRDTLEKLLHQCGLELLTLRATAKEVSAGQVLGLLAEKYPKSFSGFSRVVRKSPIRSWTMPYKLGDLVTLVARPDSGECRSGKD